MKFDVGVFLKNRLRKIKVWLKYDENKDPLH